MSVLRSPAQIAAEFSTIDAHDDTVESLAIIPAPNRRTSCKVELTLFRHWGKKHRLLRFTGCTNISLVADTKIMRRQKSSWNVSYQKSIDPLPPKLAAADKYTLFRVRFFGGVLEVIAKSYKLTHLSRRSTHNA
jgi:hypothetical protein